MTDGLIAAWTWHSAPKAVEWEGKTIWGAVTRTEQGQSGAFVASYEHRTGRFEASPILLISGAADDHCNPSVFVRPDGRIVMGAAGHTSEELWYAVSQEAGSVRDWSELRSVRPGRFWRYSYSQMVYLAKEGPQGRIYWFFRARRGSNRVLRRLMRVAGITNVWAFAKSDDLGLTWEFGHELWRERGVFQPYTHPVSNGVDTIFFSRSDNVHQTDSSARRHVMACYYRDGALHRLDGSKICAESGLPLTDHRRLDMVYDSLAAGNRPAFNLDIAVDTNGNPVIAFSTLEPIDSAQGRYANHYHLARWTGSQWKLTHVADGGQGVYEAEQHFHYSGAMAIDRADTSRVFLGMATPPGTEKVVRIESWRQSADGTGWECEEQVSGTGQPPSKSFRPVCPDGRLQGPSVLWMGGEYRSYVDWKTCVYLRRATDCFTPGG